MRNLNDKTAAITGAASGIGRALALELAAAGCQLALSDLDEDGLAETVARLPPGARRVTHTRLDVADRDAVHAWAERVVADHGAVHLIFNNAGVGLAAPAHQMDHADFRWLMDINFWGVVHGCEAFIPHIERAGGGHVVNISSIFGMVGVPSQCAYNASKFAVRGYSEALRQELHLRGKGVSLTCVHPGGIQTNIARSARVAAGMRERRDEILATFDKLARTRPEACARAIVRAVRKDRPRVLVGADARILDALVRLWPTGYQSLIRRATAPSFPTEDAAPYRPSKGS